MAYLSIAAAQTVCLCVQVIYVVGVLGRRPRIPASCPPELRALICDCWQRDARARPPFTAILGRLQARCLAGTSFRHTCPCKMHVSYWQRGVWVRPLLAIHHHPGQPAGMLPVQLLCMPVQLSYFVCNLAPKSSHVATSCIGGHLRACCPSCPGMVALSLARRLLCKPHAPSCARLFMPMPMLLREGMQVVSAVESVHEHYQLQKYMWPCTL